MRLLGRHPRRLASGISSEPIADDQYWREVSGWWRRDRDLTSERFAEILGVKVDALRQYRSREKDFPTPVDRIGRPCFAPADVYPWIDAARPKRRVMIPRLFHAGGNLRPAVFVASETMELSADGGRPQTWVIHLWQPADARGIVAVAYGEHHTADSEDRAAELLERLPNVSSVAVVTDALCHFAAADSVDESFQPEIAVAERHLGTYRRGWFALAALLRVNLPWWPAGLRRSGDIAAWRPGASPQAIRPTIPGRFDDSVLGDLLKESDPQQASQCAPLVHSLNRRIEGEIYRTPPVGADVPGCVERPGLVQAARPFYSITESPQPLRWFEALELLGLSGAAHATRAAARDLLRGRPEMEAAVSYTIRARATDGPLAQEWISRLEPCEDPQTLGSAFAEMMMTDEQRAQPRTWWKDPKDGNCWIVEALDGTYHATVASRCGAAHGRLTEFELAESCTAALLRADGWVWPMPVPAMGGYYTCGYEGRGPSELARTVALLRLSADADLREASLPVGPPPELVRYIESHQAPLSVFADDIPGL